MTAPAATVKGPLAGTRVLDLTSVVMGPYCTQLLADLGAEVVKVESREGDSTRYVGVAREHGRTGTFLLLNRGKRSIVIDLQRPEGRAVCLELARRSDLFVHSIRPGAMQRLGLDYAAIKAVNPGIVYCNLLGFGRGGRYSGKAAYDDTIQAISGLAMLQAERGGTPEYVTTVVGDKVAALSAAYALMAAMIHRLKTGEGQEIDVPMFETTVSFVLAEHMTGSVFDPPIGRPVYARLTAASRRPIRTQDGYLSVMVYTDRQWTNFTRIAGRPELAVDARFSTLAARSANVAEYYALIESILMQGTCAHWLPLLEEGGIPSIRLNRPDDLLSDPHLADVGFFKSIETPADGKLRVFGSPLRLSATPPMVNEAAPGLGEHTCDILTEAGYDAGRIAELLDSGVVAQEPPRSRQGPHA